MMNSAESATESDVVSACSQKLFVWMQSALSFCFLTVSAGDMWLGLIPLSCKTVALELAVERDLLSKILQKKYSSILYQIDSVFHVNLVNRIYVNQNRYHFAVLSSFSVCVPMYIQICSFSTPRSVLQ